jgi:hypothetical protein
MEIIMDDLERYGDYNEIDEPPKKSPVLLIIKIAAIAICAAVIGLLGFRIFLFNNSPKVMQNLYFTENLTAYYTATDGRIGALTQKLRAPYDDEKEGNFFCDNLIVIPGCGELQLSLRFNRSLGDTLREKYGILDFDAYNTEQFSFRLWRDGEVDGDPGYEIGRLTVSEWEDYSMYRYCKLVFDGIDFDGDELSEAIEWIRLEVFIDGTKENQPFMIPVYENHEGYSAFDEYILSKGETP